MKVNFIIENYSKGLNYIGCCTMGEYLADALRKKGIDVKINSTEDGFDILHAHTFGPLAMRCLKKNNKISVITAHSLPSINKGNVIGPGFLWDYLYRNIYNKFDYVLLVSKTSEKELKDIGISRKMAVSYNAINPKDFKYNSNEKKKFEKKFNINKDDLVVLHISQITPRKGVYDFIETARLLPDIKFIWIGGFSYSLFSKDYFKLRKIVKSNAGLSNLIFTGFMKSTAGALSRADIYFAPSKVESFGLTIIEAASFKLPIVARNLLVYKELFKNNILYGNGPRQFAGRINTLRNRAIRKRSAIKANKIVDKYTINKTADELIKFYKNALSAARKKRG